MIAIRKTGMIAEAAATLWSVLAGVVALLMIAVPAWLKSRDKDMAAKREADKADVLANADQITKLWGQIDKMEKHSDAQDKTIAVQNSTIASLNTINATQNGEIADLQKLLVESRKEKQLLRQQCEGYAREIDELQQHIAKLEKQVNPPLSAQT